jgi:regulator of replication initiation timing
VSLKTAYESGIPPARERLARSTDSDAALDQLELVLVESTRAEANLGLLMRGLKHLAAGAGAAQEANAILVQELEGLRARMSKVYESESLLQKRVQTLENALDATARERESWLVQEDAFLAGLLDEHEQNVFEIGRVHERKLAELDLAFDELRRQYDNSKTEVLRLTYERDAAVALLNEPVASTERTPSPTPPSAGRMLGGARLPKPVLKQKPELSSRPIVGYSMASDDILEEHLDSAKINPRPPRA